jgi:hypothetical protein
MFPIPANKAVRSMCIAVLYEQNTILIFIVCNKWQLRYTYAKYLWISIILSAFHDIRQHLSLHPDQVL